MDFLKFHKYDIESWRGSPITHLGDWCEMCTLIFISHEMLTITQYSSLSADSCLRTALKLFIHLVDQLIFPLSTYCLCLVGPFSKGALCIKTNVWFSQRQ